VTSSSSTNEFSSELAPSIAATPPRTGRSRRRSSRQRLGGRIAAAGYWTSVGLTIFAPLAIGGVHRGNLILLMGAALVSLVLFLGGGLLASRAPRVGLAVVLPCAFLIVPALQSIPLRGSVRAAVDPAGSALLADPLIATTTSAPLSLDPPSTRADVGKAAVALAIFLIAFHAAAGQKRRHVFLRAVAAVGVCAVLVGVGHRVFAVSKIYGLVNSTARTLIIGPFVNANHTAELLELSAFVCFACVFLRPTAVSKAGWTTAAILCLGGVAATLSRGAVLGVAAGGAAFVIIRLVTREDRGGGGRQRLSAGWLTLVLGFVVLGAVAMGAGQLFERFETGGVANEIRFRLWRDSLRVLAAHPFGIGRGAFERVFPVYRTITNPFPIRFSFVENQPLQLLIDSGWVLFALLVAGVGTAIWCIVRGGRRDRTEALLLAGLIAVCVHSLFDFGLETLGVLAPFSAVLGTVIGRARTPNAPERHRLGQFAIAAAAFGLVVGVASVARASSDDFDHLLTTTHGTDARLHLLERAQRAHPLDYYYVLAYARLEPLKADGPHPSPRLHALNRALMLCPRCETVHAEVARNLWSLGLRRQSLLEWRSTVQLQPLMLREAFTNLFAAGARPQELAAIASNDPTLMVTVADLFRGIGRNTEALAVLDQAEALGGPAQEILIGRAQLQLQLGQAEAARATMQKAKAEKIDDPRLSLLEARYLLVSRDAAAADDALSILDAAAAKYPVDLPIQRARVELVRTYSKWRAIDRALEGLRRAVYANQAAPLEAHLAAGRTYLQLSRFNDALNEYQIAALDAPNDVSLWMEFGAAATTAGRAVTARDAYSQAARLSPNDPAISRALQAANERLTILRTAQSGSPSAPLQVP
jgi:Flp pilus assembly protein TadD